MGEAVLYAVKCVRHITVTAGVPTISIALMSSERSVDRACLNKNKGGSVPADPPRTGDADTLQHNMSVLLSSILGCDQLRFKDFCIY